MPSVHLPPWIARQAAELLARPGHAWLLQGPSGLGQFELALALAAEFMAVVPGPPAQPSPVHLTSAGQGS